MTLPLRFHVEIYSGITPPAALLDAIASRPPGVPSRPSNISAPSQAPAYDPMYPPQLPPGANPGTTSDAPPSYEDAMADEISPADGPRREYSGVTDVNAPGLDEKGEKMGGGPPPPGGSNGGGSHSAVV